MFFINMGEKKICLFKCVQVYDCFKLDHNTDSYYKLNCNVLTLNSTARVKRCLSFKKNLLWFEIYMNSYFSYQAVISATFLLKL